MQYQLTCSCGKTHAVSTSQAGQTLPCACGQFVQIPTYRELTALPKIESAAADAKHFAGANSATSAATISLAVLFALFFLSFPTALYFGYQRWSIDTSFTEESDRANAEKMLDEADPIAISETWNHFSTTGLTNPVKPPFYHVAVYTQYLERVLLISGSIAALSILGVAAISVARRESKRP